MAAPSIRQSVQDAGATSSRILNLPSAPLAGTTLVLVMAGEDAKAINSITQTGATWILIRQIQNPPGGGSPDAAIEIWAANNISFGAAQSISVDFTGSPNPTGSDFLWAAEVLNIESPAVDQIVSNSGTNSPATTGTTAVTTQADTFAIAGISSHDSADTHTSPQNGFTIETQSNGGGSPPEQQHASVLSFHSTVAQALGTGVTISPGAGSPVWAAALVVLRAFAPGLQSVSGASVGASGVSAAASVQRQVQGAAAGVSDGSGIARVDYGAIGSIQGQGGGVGAAFSTTTNPPLEVEIPAVYIDDTLADELGAGLELINRVPEADETQVPIDTTIELDIVNIGTAAIDTAATIITVDGTIAYSSGSFINGFTGSATALTSPGAGSPDGLRFIITPPSAFLSLQVISVRVESDQVGGSAAIDVTYSFTIQDLTPPEAVSATAIDKKLIRIVFDEPVRALGDGAAADALTATNYTFVAVHDSVSPAVDITAVAITQISDTEYEIETDIEMTRRETCEAGPVQYIVTINNIEDLFGNIIADAATFDGFQPNTPSLRSFCIYQMFATINREEDQTRDLLRFSNVLQDVVDLLLCDIDDFINIFDIDRADNQFLDAILAALGNPFAFDLDENQKRKLSRILIDIYKLKGTADGICAALRFFLQLTDCSINEYNDLDGWSLGDDELGTETFLGLDDSASKYSFDVEVDRVLTDEERRQLREIVDFMKPAHTHHINTLEP